MAGDTDFVFQQDSAPAHTAKKMVNMFKSNNVLFWDSHTWPPNSPDMNPMDYYFYGKLEGKVCSVRHPNITSLRTSISKEWVKVSAAEVTNACSSFRSRIERMTAAMSKDYLVNSTTPELLNYPNYAMLNKVPKDLPDPVVRKST